MKSGTRQCHVLLFLCDDMRMHTRSCPVLLLRYGAAHVMSRGAVNSIFREHIYFHPTLPGCWVVFLLICLYNLGHPGGYEHYGLFVVRNQLPK